MRKLTTMEQGSLHDLLQEYAALAARRPGDDWYRPYPRSPRQLEIVDSIRDWLYAGGPGYPCQEGTWAASYTELCNTARSSGTWAVVEAIGP